MFTRFRVVGLLKSLTSKEVFCSKSDAVGAFEKSFLEILFNRNVMKKTEKCMFRKIIFCVLLCNLKENIRRDLKCHRILNT